MFLANILEPDLKNEGHLSNVMSCSKFGSTLEDKITLLGENVLSLFLLMGKCELETER